YGSTGKPHPFHIVKPSPWPMLASFAAGILALGAAFGFHDKGWLWAYVGGASLIAVAAVWFRDIIREATHNHEHSAIVKIGFRYGMLLFIASEVMFFAAFFWAFFDASLFPKEGIGGIWPPAGITTIAPFDLPFLMTMI